jgi:peptide/nickel transport system substrate-binding protein
MEQLNRRRFLTVGAAAAAGIGAAVLLDGCSSGGSAGGGTSSSAGGGATTSPVSDSAAASSAAGGAGTTGASSSGAAPGSSTAGSGTPKTGGTLRFATGGGTPKDTVDPATAGSAFTQVSAGLLYDTLVRADVDFNLQPALATEWSSSTDAATWTFRLRDGVKFHDGRAMTSADVAFSIKRVLDPKVGSGQLSAIQPFLAASGISTPDATTVKFTLTSPNAFFPIILTSVAFGIIPEGTTDVTKGIGTGPFTLGSFAAAANAQFNRNGSYWRDGRPYLDAVRIATVTEDATRIQALLAGSQDMVDTVTGTSIALLKGTAAPLAIPAGGWVDLAAWGDTAPFDNPLVVDAMKYAQDRQKIMDVVAPGMNKIGPDVPVPSSDPFFPDDLQPRAYDPDKAKGLLKQAGHGDGLDLTLYAYPGDKLDFALAYKESAKAAGININVINWPHATYWDQVYMKKPFIGDSWARLHTSTILNTVFQSASSSNESRFNSPELDKLLADAVKTTDLSQQKQMYGQALHIIDKSAACLIPGWEPQVYGVKTTLQGVEIVNGLQAYFDGAHFAS